MGLYTVFAWTAIVIAGGAYYWVYIRQAPLPTHLVGLSQKPSPRQSHGDGSSSSSAQKRKRKSGAPKSRTAVLQTNELVAGASGVSADESEDTQTKSMQQLQDEAVGRAENELKGKDTVHYHKLIPVDSQPPRKQIKRATHSSPSDADESDALDKPTPAPSNKQSSSGLPERAKNAAESRFEKVTPKTAVDDMIAPEDRPAVARVMRIASPSNEITETTRPPKPRTDSSGPAVDKDGLTKKQRQNLKKKERHREARAREEAIRQSQLRAHQKELETIRLNNQIKAAEKKSTQVGNAWEQTGRPAMEESVYTIRNLSEENLTTVGHRSDGAGSEEGWQEVTSKAAKKAANQKAISKQGSGSDGSEDSSSVNGSEGASTSQAAGPAYATNNSFANLDS